MPPVQRVLKQDAPALLKGLKPTIGFAASLLAVWCQILLLATISLAPLTIGADAVETVPICHAADGTQPAQQKPDHPAHNCILCVLCVSHASTLAILSPPMTFPERLAVVTMRRYTAQPRAPPFRLVAAAQPRGPPSLI